MMETWEANKEEWEEGTFPLFIKKMVDRGDLYSPDYHTNPNLVMLTKKKHKIVKWGDIIGDI